MPAPAAHLPHPVTMNAETDTKNCLPQEMNTGTDTKNYSPKARKALRWLSEMSIFYAELLRFLQKVPADSDASAYTQIPEWVQKDPAFATLHKLSQHCKYMPGIPLEECMEAVEAVQDLSREALVAVFSHPTFSTFIATRNHPPFFERAMTIGSALGVEHQIAIDDAIRQNRRAKRKRVTEDLVNMNFSNVVE